MHITKIEVNLLSIKLREPLAISFHSFDYQHNFFLRLHGDDGLIGWGEAAPFKPITGDSAEEVLAEIKQLSPDKLPALESTDQFYDAFISSIASPTLRAALDMAAHDLIAKRRGIPVYRLYRSSARKPPNCVTVFIKESLAQTRDEASRIITAYPHLKLLKIKLKGEGDIERCRAIRGVVPSHLKFVLDANQGFADASDAVNVLTRAIALLGEVVAIEEPCPKGQYQMMKFVKGHLPQTIIMADESCAIESDLEAIIRHRCAGGVNIKLQKCGGITPGKRMAHRAAEAGMSVMMGEMFEDALGTSAGVHFAASTENVILTDLDMDLDLPLVWSGQTPFVNGARVPLEQTGFGFQIEPKRFADFPQGTVRILNYEL